MNAPDTSEATARRGALPLAEAIGTRRLVAAIVVMPIIAIIAVLVIVLYAKDREAVVSDDPRSADLEAPEPLRLGPGGRVVETVSDGRHLIVRTQSDRGGEIVIYDIATGARLRSIAVIPE